MTTTKKALSYQISTIPTSYIPKVEDFYSRGQIPKNASNKITAFNEPELPSLESKFNRVHFLDTEQLKSLFQLDNKTDINRFFVSSINKYPPGRPKDLLVRLMEDVLEFCKKQSFDEEKVAITLFQFYSTHEYFTLTRNATADKIYLYFKELMLSYSLPFPPDKTKIFTVKECSNIINFFCKTYLRFLPLIKLLCMPNFALYLNYEIPPSPLSQFPKTKKGAKKEKASKAKKEKKENKKKGKKKK